MRDMVGRRSARNRALKAVGARSAMSGRLSVAGAMMAAMDEHQIVARGVSGVRVVVSASLSSYFDKRYVVVDGAPVKSWMMLRGTDTRARRTRTARMRTSRCRRRRSANET